MVNGQTLCEKKNENAPDSTGYGIIMMIQIFFAKSNLAAGKTIDLLLRNLKISGSAEIFLQKGQKIEHGACVSYI